MKRLILLLCLLAALIAAFVSRRHYAVSVSPLVQSLKITSTVDDRLAEYGPPARGRLIPFFALREVPYPPARVVLLGLKKEGVLEIHAAGTNQPLRFIRSFPILGASGELGPKLREGDRQVPEGVYTIDALDPDSRFHLALRIGYPNDFDREQARREGRPNPRGHILIHGDTVSIDCLAMGDEAVEDLFVLAGDTGLKNISLIISPVDFRLAKTPPPSAKLPAWSASLYDTLRLRLNELPKGR